MRRTILMFSIVLVLALVLVVPGAYAKKKKKRKKKGAEEAPPVGEVVLNGWTCYGSPDFGKLGEGPRREARSEAIVYLQKFVTGELREGFKIANEEDLTYFETAFLGRPSLLDTWLSENFERCKSVAEGKTSSSDYLDYLSSIGREFERGQCYKPLDYEYHNYLDIQASWQFRVHVCEGDQVLVESTGEDNGKYTIVDTGSLKKNRYITSIGDPEVPQAGELGVVAELPLGALVMRFEAEDDSFTKYYAPGYSMEWTSPAHGFLSFAVNDSTYYDNKFHDLRGAIDFLSVDIYPALAGEGTAQESVTP